LRATAHGGGIATLSLFDSCHGFTDVLVKLLLALFEPSHYLGLGLGVLLEKCLERRLENRQGGARFIRVHRLHEGKSGSLGLAH